MNKPNTHKQVCETIAEVEKGIIMDFDIKFWKLGGERVSEFEDIKDFLKSALAQQREKIVEEIRGMKKELLEQKSITTHAENTYRHGYNLALEEVIKKISPNK